MLDLDYECRLDAAIEAAEDRIIEVLVDEGSYDLEWL